MVDLLLNNCPPHQSLCKMRWNYVYNWRSSMWLILSVAFYLATFPVYPVEAGSMRILKITTVILEPYMMVDKTNSSHGIRYVGFVADLIQKLSEVVGFRYELYIAPDNKYGYRQNDGSWNGMVKELLDKNAHIAAGPLLDTRQRREVVDFTSPFLNVHATLLMRKPSTGGHTNIQSVHDLMNQSTVRYGTLAKGMIPRTFKRTNDSTLKELWRNMNRFKPSTMTHTNEEGIQRARRENYAFVLEDTIANYVSMLNPCDLITIDRFLFRRNYALAFPKKSRWFDSIDIGINMLKRSNTLDTLYMKWWVQTSKCNSERPSSRSFSLAATSSSSVDYHRYMVIIFASLHLSILCANRLSIV